MSKLIRQVGNGTANRLIFNVLNLKESLPQQVAQITLKATDDLFGQMLHLTGFRVTL
jgi:hypothetical protein